MDSKLLKVFIEVTNNKSISIAAKELGFAQSNVTSRIKQLEKILGFSLFHRVPKGVELTIEGERLYPYALDVVNKVEELVLNMKNISHQSLLRVGSTQSNATVRLLPFITKMNQQYPKMKLEVYTNTTPLVVNELLNYKIDIAFVSGNPNHKDLEVIKVFEEDIYFVDEKNSQSSNAILAYKDSCAYYTFFKNYLKNAGNNDFKTIIFENYETILGCVNAGMGRSVVPITIIEKFGYKDKLKLEKLDKNISDLSTYMVCRKDNKPLIFKQLKEINL